MAAKKKTARGGAKNIIAFVGSDEAKLKESAMKRFGQLVPPGQEDFGAEVIDGGASNAEAAVRAISLTIGALQTMPFFGSDKVVWLKGATLFADSQTGKAGSVLEAADDLMAVLEAGLPEGVTFLLSAPGIDKRRSFYLKLKKLGQIEVSDRPDMGRDNWKEEVAAVVRQQAGARRLQFDRDALELFVMMAGDDIGQIGNELDKIDLFLGAGDRGVDIALVRTHVAQTRAGVVFELGNCIGRRDLAGALEAIDRLLHHGENAIGILLAAVAPKLRGLLIAKDLLDRHRVSAGSYRDYEAKVARLPAATTAHLPRKKDGGISCYPIFLASTEARGFSTEALRSGLAGCLQANRALVTSSLDPRLVLERLVVRLLAA